MKTATVRQIRNEFSTVLEWVSRGEEVTVLKRSKPVARIMPLPAVKPSEIAMPDFESRARQIFGNKRTRLVQAVMDEREAGQW